MFFKNNEPLNKDMKRKAIKLAKREIFVRKIIQREINKVMKRVHDRVKKVIMVAISIIISTTQYLWRKQMSTEQRWERAS